jgi:hypothetical protein
MPAKRSSLLKTEQMGRASKGPTGHKMVYTVVLLAVRLESETGSMSREEWGIIHKARDISVSFLAIN